MPGRRLPENVHLFILNHVENLDALEVLLLLRRSSQPLTDDELADRVRSSRSLVKRRLEYFHSIGLVASEGNPAKWSLLTGSSLMKDLNDLAAATDHDRFSVINLIASRNLERMKSLADSFRFRGKS